MRGKDYPLVSVIVPVYGTEAYLDKCINSILNQTYHNIELIVVNDASKDNSEEIILTYKKMDSRIVYCTNSQNLGLFHTRLAGLKKANGKYLLFVDSDDYIGVDYIRRLVATAEKQDADIVKAQFVMVEEANNNYKYIYNYINNRPLKQLEEENIAYEYFNQEGFDFSWHTVCGKLYKTQLWLDCEPLYRKIKGHFIMTEDIAFSTPLFLKAEKYVEIDYDGYFYVQRKSSSTGLQKNIKKFEKNIQDLHTAFSFRENVLKEFGKFDIYKEKHIAWKKLYGRSWKNSIKWAGFSNTERKYLEKKVINALQIEELEDFKEEDGYFYSMTTTWDGREEEVIKQIMNPKIKTVSFDIFDTLIIRPFFNPEDLFYCLDVEYKNKSTLKLDLKKARVEAEKNARKELEHSAREEISLEEIYNRLSLECGISSNVTAEMMESEKKLELKYCSRRDYGYKLYELALFLEKKIMYTSDMYLDIHTVSQILTENGYAVDNNLYLSSQIGLTKATGNLFRYILKKVKKKELIHIGDNIKSDYEVPQKIGIKSILLPKSIGIMRGEYNFLGYHAGNSYYSFLRPFGSFFDHKESLQFLGIRTMLAMVANKFFDNPYKDFNSETDFNSNIYFMAYYALGMHLWGMALDVIEKSRGVSCIHFVARDGYQIKNVYDVIKRYRKELPDSNYLYLSRKALIPLVIQQPSDVFYIKNIIAEDAVLNKTPRTILAQYFGIHDDEEIEKYIHAHGFHMDSYFKNYSLFETFLSTLSKNPMVIEKNREKNKKIIRCLDKIIKGKDMIFDIGYSGTTQFILSKLLERPIKSYYAYINKDRPFLIEQQGGGSVDTFYNMTPLISGGIREFLFSKCEPSCIGYVINGMNVEPMLEENKATYCEKQLVSLVSKGVTDFATDMMQKFGDILEILNCRSYDISLPFEFLLARSSDKDLQVFSCCYFEDDIFLGTQKVQLDKWLKDYRWKQEAAPLFADGAIHDDRDYLAIANQYYNSNRLKKLLVLFSLNKKLCATVVKRNIKRIFRKGRGY